MILERQRDKYEVEIESLQQKLAQKEKLIQSINGELKEIRSVVLSYKEIIDKINK